MDNMRIQFTPFLFCSVLVGSLAACGPNPGEIERPIENGLETVTSGEIKAAYDAAAKLIDWRRSIFLNRNILDMPVVERKLSLFGQALNRQVPQASSLNIEAYEALHSIKQDKNESVYTFVLYWSQVMPTVTQKLQAISGTLKECVSICPKFLPESDQPKAAIIITTMMEDVNLIPAIDTLSIEMQALLNSERAVRLMQEMSLQSSK